SPCPAVAGRCRARSSATCGGVPWPSYPHLGPGRSIPTEATGHGTSTGWCVAWPVASPGTDLSAARSAAERVSPGRTTRRGRSRERSHDMATQKQRAAARKNVKKAVAGAKAKKSIASMPKRTRTALGQQGAAVAQRKRTGASGLKTRQELYD